jgi:hypothetical protein
MFRSLATRLIQWTISPRIEQLPDEARRRYFRYMAWFCYVLALSEALFAFLILWAWFTIVWVAPLLPALCLAVGAILIFLVAAVTFTAARIALGRAAIVNRGADR